MATFTPIGPGTGAIPLANSPRLPATSPVPPLTTFVQFTPVLPLPGILPSPGSFAMGLAPLLLPLAALLSWWLR